MENHFLEQRLFIASVKERFHGTTAETFHRFKELVKCAQEQQMDRSILFSQVTKLFTHHHDLIDKFRGLVFNLDTNRASSVQSNIRLSVTPLDKEAAEAVVRSCFDFTNRAERVLRDDDKFMSFIRVISEFQRHMNVERVEPEAFCLIKGHPELEIEFTDFLAEANAGRRVQDMVVSRRLKKKEGQERTDRGKDRDLSQIELQMFDVEDARFKSDLAYKMMVRAKEGAESLIKENSGRKNLKKEICIAGYFRGLNVNFMRVDLKLYKFLDECKLLSEKSMERGKALYECERFIRYMECRIKALTKKWDKKKRRFIEKSDKKDLQIPAFDWSAAQ